MPTHVKEVPALLLQADNSELFRWVEEKLEGIGLDGKLYSRVIKSVLRANLDEEEIELNIEHKRVSYHELIDEILLASMWKGSDKTDDYWIFKKVISDFVKKYKSRGTFSDTDVASSNELESPDERYEEAFPSLSNACDEIAWNIPRWTCMSERGRGGDLTSLITGSDDNNDDAVHIFHAERNFIWDRRFRSRRRNRRTKTMPTSTRCNDNIAINRHRLDASGGFKRHSIPCGDMTSSEETFVGEFYPCKTVGQSKGGRWRGRNSESNAALLMSDCDETGSFTSQFSFKIATTQHKLETMKAVPLELLFPNLNAHNNDNINSYTHINDSINNYCNDTNNIFYSSLNRDKRDEEGHAHSDYKSCGLGETNCGRWSDLIVFDLLTLPFMSGQLSSPSHVIQELRSLIPDYPWSSPAKNWIPCEQRFNDVQHKGSNDDDDDITDNIINASNIIDDDDDYGRVMTKIYPQSPLPYFHPDPPSYALFPWDIELNRL